MTNFDQDVTKFSRDGSNLQLWVTNLAFVVIYLDQDATNLQLCVVNLVPDASNLITEASQSSTEASCLTLKAYFLISVIRILILIFLGPMLMAVGSVLLPHVARRITEFWRRNSVHLSVLCGIRTTANNFRKLEMNLLAFVIGSVIILVTGLGWVGI